MKSKVIRYECFRCGADYPKRVPYCSSCFTDGTIEPVFNDSKRKKAAEKPEPKVIATTAKELTETHRHAKPFDLPTYPGLRILEGAFILIYGPDGAGRSALALHLLDAIHAGPVHAYLPEDGLSPIVSERIQRVGVARDNFHLAAQGSIKQFIQAARQHDARAVLIDTLSAATLRPHEIYDLDHGAQALIGVLGVNKRGQPSGPNAWRDVADLCIRVDDGRWTVEKSRYQPQPHPAGDLPFTGAN